MNDYPFELTISEEAMKVYPPTVRERINDWLAVAAKRVHEDLHKTDFAYRMAYEQWRKLKKEHDAAGKE